MPSQPGHERVFLATRKGFVKCAIQAGVDLVPVYHFHSSLLSVGAPPALAGLSRRLRAAIFYPYGWGGLPVPRADDILSVVGAAVKVEQADDPPPSVVDATHAAFVASLREAFDQHKHLAGPAYAHCAKKELEVV